MEKKTMETLRTMLCGELEDIAKKGISNHETLDILKDLLDSAKNLEKIDKYQREKEEKEKEPEMGGYSQRSMGRYYVDGRYDGGGNSYMNYDMGNSYRGYPMYERNMNMGNSQMYRDPMYYDSMYGYDRGNSYASPMTKEDITKDLRKLMAEAKDEGTKTAISEIIANMNR